MKFTVAGFCPLHRSWAATNTPATGKLLSYGNYRNLPQLPQLPQLPHPAIVFNGRTSPNIFVVLAKKSQVGFVAG